MTNYAATGAGACLLGVGLMYMLDPQRGRQRRAMAGDKITHLVKQTGRTFRRTGRSVQDLLNRGTGLAHDTRRRLRSEPVSEETLQQRVRSEMGHAISDPGAIDIRADSDGVIVVSGQILASERDALLQAIRCVAGVTGVTDRLEMRASPAAPTM